MIMRPVLSANNTVSYSLSKYKTPLLMISPLRTAMILLKQYINFQIQSNTSCAVSTFNHYRERDKFIDKICNTFTIIYIKLYIYYFYSSKNVFICCAPLKNLISIGTSSVRLSI